MMHFSPRDWINTLYLLFYPSLQNTIAQLEDPAVHFFSLKDLAAIRSKKKKKKKIFLFKSFFIFLHGKMKYISFELRKKNQGFFIYIFLAP